MYRQDIDGLRALAVIAVILNHFDEALLPSGYLGVDIFFVISGYVISSSLYSNAGKSLADLLGGFYVRRIKRLVPALALCVAVTGIVICLFDPNPSISLKTGIASLFGLSNIYLYRQATDYFGGSASLNVFTQTWSLGVEEQFYVVFPFVVWFSGFGRLEPHGARRFGRVIGAAAFVSLLAFAYLSHSGRQTAAFYAMPTRFWELAAGCLAFSVLNRCGGQPLSVITKIGRWSGVLLAILVAALFLPRELFAYSTIAVIFLTTLIIATVRPQTNVYYFLTARPAVFLGSISYSLYLWHWSVLSVSRWTIGVHWWSAPFQFALMILLAVGSYNFIERPLRRSEWAPVRWKTVALGITAIFGVSTLLAILAKPLAGTLYTGKPPSLIASGVQSLTDIHEVAGTAYAWNGAECVLSDNAEVGKNLPIDRCTLGKFENAKHRVLVLGNSFSVAFVQAFDDLIRTEDFSVTITSSWGASPVPEIPNNGPWNKANDYYWGAVVPSLISKLKRGDWVLLINDIAGFSPPHKSADSERRLQQFEVGLINLSLRLADSGVRLAVLHGNPFAREANCEPATAARQWFSPFGGPCHFLSREETLSRRQALDKVLTKLSDEGRIATVDLIDVFCPKATCSYNAANEQILYRDVWSHPSVEAARLSAPIFREVLTAPMRD